MHDLDIHIPCLQETYKALSEYYVTEEGYLMILSGRSDNNREHAGVGFLISPACRASIYGFCQASNRFVAIKIRASGGKVAIISAYALQSQRPYDERCNFFPELKQFWQSISVNGSKFIFGDFNSRIYTRFPGEESIIGDFFFKNHAIYLRPDLNRLLLIEMCSACGLQATNTFIDLPDDKLVTFRAPGTAPMDTVSPSKFAQLDLLLAPVSDINGVIHIETNRSMALASHHYLILVELQVEIDKRNQPCHMQDHFDVHALNDPRLASEFSASMTTCMAKLRDNNANHVSNIENMQSQFRDAYATACKHVLPVIKARPKQKWISSSTLKLIDQRNFARGECNWTLEKELHTLIRKSAACDKWQFLFNMAEGGSWDAVKLFRQLSTIKQGRLRSLSGKFVSSEEGAETLAEYLEKVQWAVRPDAILPDRPSIWAPLPVNELPITTAEVQKAISKLKCKKACGIDDIPPECFKALACSTDGLNLITELCQLCWQSRNVPKD